MTLQRIADRITYGLSEVWGFDKKLNPKTKQSPTKKERIEQMNQTNLACRIFKEQIDLIQQLPEDERAEVLYKAILYVFNQIENQNENAYVSVSVSISELSKTVYKLLIKNITCKEFSNNYGGRRIGAGRKKQPETPKPTENTPTLDEVLEYAKQQNDMAGVGGFKCSQETAEQFWAHYESIGWRIGNDAKTPITNWKSKLRQWAIKEKTITEPKKEPITLII